MKAPSALLALLAALALCAASGCAGAGSSGGGSGVTVFGDVDAAVTRTRSK
ncbi:hypothetical protein [Xylophilus sp. ASV27]|uniref:hypothetical protein n=1 Tax=Xylophilus sp. ASV27 TaxID=2795129 RepID=UPI0018ED3495|nr:hypothetical protein [Xylophilus sp. ASV27]